MDIKLINTLGQTCISDICNCGIYRRMNDDFSLTDMYLVKVLHG